VHGQLSVSPVNRARKELNTERHLLEPHAYCFRDSRASAFCSCASASRLLPSACTTNRFGGPALSREHTESPGFTPDRTHFSHCRRRGFWYRWRTRADDLREREAESDVIGITITGLERQMIDASDGFFDFFGWLGTIVGTLTSRHLRWRNATPSESHHHTARTVNLSIDRRFPPGPAVGKAERTSRCHIFSSPGPARPPQSRERRHLPDNAATPASKPTALAERTRDIVVPEARAGPTMANSVDARWTRCSPPSIASSTAAPPVWLWSRLFGIGNLWTLCGRAVNPHGRKPQIAFSRQYAIPGQALIRKISGALLLRAWGSPFAGHQQCSPAGRL
jgi:hypothetical protein